MLASTWQVAVEAAQVQAGLVEYPASNPFYIYQASVWTAWHQLLAPLLAAGVSERAVSILVSGALGALSFSAIAAFALAAGASAALALACPFLILFLDTTYWGFRYPINLVGSGDTYGVAGLSIALLACGLLGTARWRAGAFVLGLAPAFHAAIGGLVGVVAGAVGLLQWRALRPHWRPLLMAGSLGAALSALSLAWHLRQMPSGPDLDPALVGRHLDAFLRLWDWHRGRPPLFSEKGFVLWCGIAIAISRMCHSRAGLSEASRFALGIFVGCAALGFGFSFLNEGLPQAVPRILRTAMPTRVLNLNMLAYLPLLLGVAWTFRSDPWARALLLSLGVVSLLGFGELQVTSLVLRAGGLWGLIVLARGGDASAVARRSLLILIAYLGIRPLWTGEPMLGLRGGWALGAALGSGLVVGWAWPRLVTRSGVLDAATRRLRVDRMPGLGRRLPTIHLPPAWLATATGLAFAAFPVVTTARAMAGLEGRLARLRDRTEDPALAEASRATGLLAVAPGVFLIQLRTRHPVILEVTALDMLPYAPEGGPELARILRDVYGVDFFRPPPRALHHPEVPQEPVRWVWEHRPRARWREVARRFGISHVLTPPGWRLRLPETSRSEEFVLYRIPAPGEPRPQ